MIVLTHEYDFYQLTIILEEIIEEKIWWLSQNLTRFDNKKYLK
jgi:hypothetical protein